MKKISSTIILLAALTAANVSAQSGDDPETVINVASSQQNYWKQQLRHVLSEKADGWVVDYNDDGTARVMVVGETNVRAICANARSITKLKQLIITEVGGRKIIC